MATSDLDMMRASAQRVMAGGNSQAATSPKKTSSSHRTIPTATLTTNSENLPMFARADTPTVRITLPVAHVQPTFTTTRTPASPPALAERNMNIQTAAAGLSLIGNAESLKEAREFLQSTANGKSRPSRGNPTKISPISSPREPAPRNAAVETSRPLPVTTPVRARNEPNANPTTSWQGFSSLHDRPAVTSGTSASTPAAGSTPPPTHSTYGFTANTKAALTTPASSELKEPTAPEKKAKPESLRDRQMADINSTMTGVPKEVPPHLRAKAAAGAAKPSTSTVTSLHPTISTKTSKPGHGADISKPTDSIPALMVQTSTAASGSSETAKTAPVVKPVPQNENKPRFEPVTPTPTAFTFTAKPIVQDKPTGTTTSAVAEKEGTKAKPIIINGHHTPALAPASAPTSSKNDVAMHFVAALQREVAALTSKVYGLETDSVYLSEKLEELVHADHRRRFLGTDSAKVPYRVAVTYPNGTTRPIQADRQTRIAGLIRSARIAALLKPDDSKNPRLSFNGETVGHGMTLGELGILSGATVSFIYDGASEEPEEDL